MLVKPFQQRNWEWVRTCFGRAVAESKGERALRFLEEALEVVQACGMGQGLALSMVDYVYGRDVGRLRQEIGGAMVCLAALASAHEIDLDTVAEAELSRCMANTDKIRDKHAAKAASVKAVVNG